MKFLTRIALVGAALLAVAGNASAQAFNTIQVTTPITQRTYEASIVGLAPAASATDLFTVTGAAGKIVKVTRVECSGTATAAGAASLVALVRSTANSAGTSTTPTIVAADQLDGAGAAVVRAYTANPTVGTSLGAVRVVSLGLAAAASATAAAPVNWTFGNDVGTRTGIVLRGAAQVFALNGNGASFPAGSSLNCSVEWTEQ